MGKIREKRHEKGITFVALVVTIVTLLILAGVSISLIIGNNSLFDKAKNTQKVQTIAGIKEALELEKIDIQVENKTVNLGNYLEQISTGKKNYDLSSKETIDDKNAYIIVNDQYKFLLKDKENGDVEITYEGVAVSGDLTLSSYEETYTYPNSGTFTVTNNVSGGELSVESDAPNIATASIKENTITVVPGTTAGKANIIVKSSANGEYAENKVIHVATVENGTISLSVTPYEGTYDGQAHNAITQVDVNPSDAKLEYSLDGNTYSETMPTITNTSEFTVTVKASKVGYKTQTTTETVKVNKANGSLTLSATSGTIAYPNSTSFTVSNNTGSLSVSSSNSNIASASISGNTVTVKSGTTAGNAAITVTSAEASNYNEKTATYIVTVQNGAISLSATPYTGTYDGKAHNALTKVNVNPSDAKIEYSTNGTSYSTTMPTITNTSSFTVTVKASKAGYKTQTTTETVKVNKANGSLTLSATSGTIAYPNSTSFTVSNNTGSLSVSSSNSNIASASISGNTVTVKSGTTAGKATITVTSAEASNYNAKSATYTATVQNGTISLSATPYSGTYDGKAHNALTKVSVNPSDAKIEYSTNGTSYRTTMPTITNTSSFTVTVKASKAGYKTQTTTETVKVNKAAGSLKLSATSGTLTYPTSTSFTVSGNTGTLSVSSNNTNIATASISGNTVTVKPGTTAGKATITVTSAAATNYNAKSATYTATVQNGTISLSATPYSGTYDGKAHNALTKVSVNPSDAKIEYSINGGTYSTTMPTITNVSSFTVTVRASKVGYKTISITKTVSVALNINALKIGDYVNYTYDSAGSYSLSSTYSGYSSNQTIAQTTGLTWKVLNVDKENDTVDIISENPTSQNVYFRGILGYNNGPYLMNEICKAQYSNKSLGVNARSINLLDMEKHLTTSGITARNAYTNAVKYGKTKTYTSNTKYPSLYANQKGAGPNIKEAEASKKITQPDTTKGNDPYEESKPIVPKGTTEPTNDSTSGTGSPLTVTQTYYNIPINDTNYGTAYSILANGTPFWVAARFVRTDSSGAGFGLRCAGTVTYGSIMFYSVGSTNGNYYALRPVVSLPSSLLTGEQTNGAWNLSK